MAVSRRPSGERVPHSESTLKRSKGPEIVPSTGGVDGDNTPPIGDKTHDAANSAVPTTRGNRQARDSTGRFRRERAYSMGRYPFSLAVEAYLERIRPEPPFNSGYSPATYVEKSRKLRMLARLFNGWRDQGLVATSDPSKFTEREINFLIMKYDHLSVAYVDKLLDHLGAFLEDIGNSILTRMRKQHKLPTVEDGEIETVDDAWFAETMLKLEPVEGWRGTVLRFVVAVFFSTGLRSKELRTAKLVGLDTTRWTLDVTPKGTGKWANRTEMVRIFPSARTYIVDFLVEREKMVRSFGLDPSKVEPLIPQTEDGKYYSPDGWRMLRWKVFKGLGIHGDFRLLRRSFGQRLKDRNLPIEEVSRTMRHKSTQTTEKYYARVKSKKAWDAAEKVWEEAAASEPETN